MRCLTDLSRAEVSVGVELREGSEGILIAYYRCNNSHDGYNYLAEFIDEDHFPELEGLASDLVEKQLRPSFSAVDRGDVRLLTDREIAYLAGRWRTLAGFCNAEPEGMTLRYDSPEFF